MSNTKQRSISRKVGLERVPASLDAATRRTIAKLLFEEWLEERRQAAHIEWNWGSAHRITQVES